MAQHRIPYHLPLSAIRFSGVKTVTTDALGGRDEDGLTTTSWRSTAELVTVADHATYCSEVKTGWVFNSNVTLNFTDDARLTKADVDTSGAASALVKGAVTAGVALVAATIGPAVAPAAAAAATVAPGGLRGVEFGEEAADEAQTDEESASREPEDRIAAAYAQAHPHEAELRKTLIEQIRDAERAWAGSLEELVADMSPDALKEHQAKHTAIEMARVELDRVQQHFAAWRSSRVVPRNETHEQIVTLDALAASTAEFDDGAISWSGDTPDWATALWNRVGLLAIVHVPSGKGEQPPAAKSQPGVYIRHPRRAVIEIYRRTSHENNWNAELVSVDDHLVVDAGCATNLIRFRSSAWSKRKVTVTMSETGFLTAYAHETTSSAKEIGDALGGLPASVEDALGKASAIRDKVTALENKARDEAKADLDAEIERKKQEIVRDGLLATAADQIELERLTQQKALLDQQALVEREAGAAELAVVKQELELAQKKRELATELELAEVRMEIARLQSEMELLAAKNGD